MRAGSGAVPGLRLDPLSHPRVYETPGGLNTGTAWGALVYGAAFQTPRESGYPWQHRLQEQVILVVKRGISLSEYHLPLKLGTALLPAHSPAGRQDETLWRWSHPLTLGAVGHAPPALPSLVYLNF